MNDVTLICGDSLTTLYDLVSQSIQVDAIITDPPYNINQAKWDKYKFLTSIIHYK